jgi:hypothetical protein
VRAWAREKVGGHARLVYLWLVLDLVWISPFKMPGVRGGVDEIYKVASFRYKSVVVAVEGELCLTRVGTL